MTRLKVIQEPKNRPSSIKNILAIAAGKGGVGKSSVAVNLALSLKSRGYQVGILDADVYGPSLEQMLPVGMEPVENLENPERILPGLAFGMPVISVAHFKKEASIVRAPIANQIIEQFLGVVDWGDLDFLVIDFPPGTGDIQITLMQKASISAAIMVTTPQNVAILDVRKAIQLFLKMHIPVLGVVENMSYFLDPVSQLKYTPFGQGGGQSLSKEFRIPFLGEIPIDSLISEMGDRGLSLLEQAPESLGAQAFSSLTSQIISELNFLSTPQSQVRQKDAYHLEIKLDRGWVPLSLHWIQMHCPCARCLLEKKSNEQVSLLEFSPVGRYAIRLTFSTGCSQGIYPLDLLEKLVK